MSTPPTSKNISTEYDNGNFEMVLASDTGTITFRENGDHGIWLGLTRGNKPEDPPEILVLLTERQHRNLLDLLVTSKRW